MTKILRYLTVLTTLLLFVLPAQATLYSYILRSEGKPTSASYYYRIAAWTPPAPGSMHPCLRVGLTKSCYVNINHRHTNADRGGVASRNNSEFQARCRLNLATLPDATAVYNYISNSCFSGLPFDGQTDHKGDPIRNECVTLFLTDDPKDGHGYMYPDSICGVAPPPGGICSFTADYPNAILDHGRVPDNEINGDQTSQYLRMKCNKDTAVRIYSVSDTDARLKLKNNLYSRLTLNGYPLNSSSGGVPVYVRGDYETTALLKSTLESTGPVEAGPFIGNISIIMTID
ncbi:MrfJ [Morganella morganii]|uniref:MrpH family fimbial adhesin n=1 Tax=Morganella morganii TaxID=582 RepID=UPI00189ABD2B|nr:MrfJ [Morganella morganii]